MYQDGRTYFENIAVSRKYLNNLCYGLISDTYICLKKDKKMGPIGLEPMTLCL